SPARVRRPSFMTASRPLLDEGPGAAAPATAAATTRTGAGEAPDPAGAHGDGDQPAVDRAGRGDAQVVGAEVDAAVRCIDVSGQAEGRGESAVVEVDGRWTAIR